MSEAISTPLSHLSQLPQTSTTQEIFFAAVVAALVYQALLVYTFCIWHCKHLDASGKSVWFS